MAETIEQMVVRLADTINWCNDLENGAASCVNSFGCHGVTQDDLVAFARACMLNAEPYAHCQPGRPHTAVAHDIWLTWTDAWKADYSEALYRAAALKEAEGVK